MCISANNSSNFSIKNKERRNEKKTHALVTYPTSPPRKNNI